jgi:glutathionylspermidine synthase
MRFDFHLSDEGWRISEVNADVPGGYIEASGITELMSTHYPECAIAGSPAALLADSLDAAFGPSATIAMVHATVYFDDHQVMRFLGKHLAERGLHPVFVSPHQLRWRSGRAELCRSLGGKPMDGIVRFYPSEWLPGLKAICAWDKFFGNSLTPISNPATVILIQSKRFPLIWDDLGAELKLWRNLLPETRAVEEVAEMEEWVIKPVFGRVGEDIAISGCTPQPRMKEIHLSAKRNPSQWVAQRRFRALPLETDDGAVYPTIGVFVIDGKASGAYGRIAHKPLIDNEAQDIAILIAPGDRP